MLGRLAAPLALAVTVATLWAGGPATGQEGGDPVLVGAGDIGSCRNPGVAQTASLVALAGIDATVATFGDHAYPRGTDANFAECYEPFWGQFKARTMPSPGNHEYETPGASGYFKYFGAAAGDPGEGYYSYDLGSWHIVALNSNCKQVGGCEYKSTQGRWLRRDLTKHPARCTLAYFHHPLYASGNGYDSPKVKPFWHILYNHHVDVILSGHAHRYERFARIRPSGKRSSARGIRQFIVGTGGAMGGDQHGPDEPRVQAKKIGAPGVLKLELGSRFYRWKFVPVAGRHYTDSGRARCH